MLRRLICLCSDCHRTTHFGYAQVKGNLDAIFAHFRAVTGMSVEQAQTHIRKAFHVWERRSAPDWTLDLSLITTAGITLAQPPAAQRRAGIAATELQPR